MRPLSATECINPALERTKDLLARPFRVGTFLKIAAVACFAELGGGFSFNLPGRGGNAHSLPASVTAFLVAFAVFLGLIALVIGLVLFYLGSRLQLVLVEMVAARQKIVGPVWRRNGAMTWRWIGLKLLFALIVMLTAAVAATPFVLYFVRHPATAHPPVAAILIAVITGLVVMLPVVACYMLLRDFVLPTIALEGGSISEALTRVRSIAENEPGSVALYLVLKVVLVLVAFLGAEMLIAITTLISLLPFGVVGGGLWLGLRHSGPAGMVVLIFFGVLAGLVFLTWIVCVAIGALGSVHVFSQAFALYFLGGRYPLLGDLLESSAPLPYPGPLPDPGMMLPYIPPPQTS